MRAALNSLETEFVVLARRSGCTWAELAQDLELTAGGVRRRHLASDPILARPSTKPPTIEEYHAELVAALRTQGRFLECEAPWTST